MKCNRENAVRCMWGKCQSDSFLDSHPHGNITMWVEHKTRHTQSVNQTVSG